MKSSFTNISHKKTLKIINKLEFYWENKLPILDNKKTWFFKVSREFEISMNMLIDIEKKHRPRDFKPSKVYPQE